MLAAALPASAPAAGLIAAYDRYETGKGFEIGLVNASTGTRLTVAPGVNTGADELHPALSSDGRYMLFERMQLLPKLNGDIVAPTARTLFMLDRQTGVITTLATGNGAPAGPTFAIRPTRTVTWGVAPHSTTCCIMKFQAVNADNTIGGSTGFPLGFAVPPAGELLDGTHAMMDSNPHQPLRLLGQVRRQHGRSAHRRDDNRRAPRDRSAARRLRRSRRPGKPPHPPER